ncbi:hypothetical protein HYH02_000220 [Chlamydomonas schloesseri]|uniref:FIST domain-containing protein n=1 Tax=Chlamydomonas schloesseri TaxID=2026947 RepID=A0A835WM18_9CHLO|nr:hypothetical protein HYH02_000220 [Chlamydomonas schloesseri]|eukprot:KAG2450117.1 hypothetical protein HYH02_000220 [Chlamydomonas schloesseri]
MAAPTARGLASWAAQQAAQQPFFFTSACYRGRSLLTASKQLAQQVKEQLGPNRPPHLITLFATPYHEWGATLSELPQSLRTLLAAEGGAPPLVIGGVLRTVSGGAHTCREGEACVALMAAHLPGVRLHPFATDRSSLPSLGGGGSWAEVMRLAAARAAGGGSGSSSGSSGSGGGGTSAVGASGAGAAVAKQQHEIGSGPSNVSSGGGFWRSSGGALASMGRDRDRGRARSGGTGPGAGGGPQDAALGLAGPSPATASKQPPKESVATFMLTTPHFVQVEELLSRLGQVAPAMPVFGGVSAAGAWGDSESSWGAVWMNDNVMARGAVGCVMQGPFQLDTIVTPGFRGAGPVMRVTQAWGQQVLELDGEPAQRPLQRAMSDALNSGEFATSLKIGVGDATGAPVPAPASPQAPRPSPTSRAQQPRPPLPRAAPDCAQQQQQPDLGAQHAPQARQQQQPQQQLVTRNWFFQQGPPRPVLTLYTAGPVAVGTPIQVHLQNYPSAHRAMRDQLRAYAEALPAQVAAAPGAVGVLGLSCSGLPFFEDTDVARCLPRAAFAGGKVEGEFGSTAPGRLPSRLHSFTSCLALLRAADGASGGAEESTGGGSDGGVRDGGVL